jgi:thiol-disulfide isomerase/thioredoxin
LSAALAVPVRKPTVVRWAVVVSIASFVGLALVAGLLVRGDSGGSVEAATGSAPTFELPDVNDPATTVSLPAGEPTVLYFFASWCVPCRKELPIVEDVSKSRTDVAFVGINHLDQRDDAREFMKTYGSTLPTGHDPGGNVLLKYRLRGLPATVFIDANGDIESTIHGVLTRDTLLERIDDLVAKNSQVLQGRTD